MDWATSCYSPVFMPAGKSRQQGERPLSPFSCPESQEMPSIYSSVLLSFLIILNSHDEVGGEFSWLWECTSVVALDSRRDFTSDTTMSPLCPCQKDRIKWEPYLLLRVCRVLKCTDHLVIQGACGLFLLEVWTLLITDCLQQGLSWRGWEVCGPKLLSSLFWAGSGACAVCMCCCLVTAVGSGNQEWFFCSSCEAKKNRSLKGVRNLSSCCYGQCYCIVLFYP